jgi:hypothetical protein
MKITFAFLLSLILLFPTITKAWLLADFMVHQKEIAEKLCENKDKPKLQCNGKCQMMKSLKKAEEPQPWKYQHGFNAIKEVKHMMFNNFSFEAILPIESPSKLNHFYFAVYPKTLIKPAIKPPCA